MGRRRKSGTPTRTTVVVVQDKSGSMSSRRSATISGFNEYVGTLKREAVADESDVQMTLTQFDTSVRNVYTSRPIAQVPALSNGAYVPGGMTALYDAVGRAVRATELAARKNERVLVVIMTDGGENSSREYRHHDILSLMEQKRRDGWEFIFLGAGEEAWNTGQSLGFTYNNSINYGLDAAATCDSFGEVALASVNVMRGSTASNYLASSPVKQRLEYESGYVVPNPNVQVVDNTIPTQFEINLIQQTGHPILVQEPPEATVTNKS